jgi:uncharacterized protein YndB with AHSA1/START domain
MIATVNVTKLLKAPSESVWKAIRSIGGLERWFPLIDTCRLEGEGVGAVRIMGLAGGGEIRDRILEIADSDRLTRYHRFQSPFPVKSYIGTVEVRDADDRGTVISWEVRVDVAERDRDELLAFIERALSDGIDGLERELTSGI